MLLPPEDQEVETEEDDPRADLVRRLLEYQQFKHASEGLAWREEVWRDVFRRENQPDHPVEEGVVLSEVSLFDLMEALQVVLARVPKDKVLEIVPDELSVRQRMSQMMERLEKVDGLIFETLFEGQRTRAAVIVTFLALLELIRLQLVNVQQIRIFEAIWISKTPETKEAVNGEF
jgi:segregation and condensation protein A